jgi:hypothetical protein
MIDVLETIVVLLLLFVFVCLGWTAYKEVHCWNSPTKFRCMNNSNNYNHIEIGADKQ